MEVDIIYSEFHGYPTYVIVPAGSGKKRSDNEFYMLNEALRFVKMKGWTIRAKINFPKKGTK